MEALTAPPATQRHPCDTPEPSHPANLHAGSADSLGVMFTIVIGTDESGAIPLLLHEEDALPGGAFRWRLVAQTDDEGVADSVMALMIRRCLGEPPSVA
jgi:hypothetical protein